VYTGVVVILHIIQITPTMDTKQERINHNKVIHLHHSNNHTNIRPNDTHKRIVKYLSSRSSSSNDSLSSSSSSSAWDHYSEDDEQFIRQIPKIELHVHLDGAFDPDYLWNYMEQQQQYESRQAMLQRFPNKFIPPWDPTKTLYIQNDIRQCQNSHDYHTLCTCRGQRSLAYMLNCFQYFLPYVSNQLELLEQLSYDFVVRQYEQNIIYTEVRYSPHEFCVKQQLSELDQQQQQQQQQQQAHQVVNDITADMIVQTVTKGLRSNIMCNYMASRICR
jgi:hypothetical protein